MAETRQPPAPTPAKRPRQSRRWVATKCFLLQLYRLSILCLLVLLTRQHFERLRILGDAPIELEEVESYLPDAARLQIDTGPRAGQFVFDEQGNDIGYAIRTSPQSEDIIGYAGPTDTLLVFGPPDEEPNPVSLADPQAKPEPPAEPSRKVLGIKIRKSWDTTRHIQWVRDDAYFMQFWKGRDWDNLARIDYYDEYMEGVSGATLSSMGIARSIQHRIRWADTENLPATPNVTFAAADIGILIALVVGLIVTFRGGWKRNKKFWTALKIAAFVYVGFLNGSLIAISVLAGYTANGIAWQVAPGLVSLVLVSLVVPWSTRRQPYCNHICPHGAAQQLLSRYSPWRIKIPKSVADGLRWTPWLLLLTAAGFLVLELPLNFSHLEPFDAYLFWQSDWIPIGLFVGSLLISAVVPMAYCKYGCPTGAVLEYVRSHGQADTFGRRDLAAGLLLACTWLLITQYDVIHAWIRHPLVYGPM